MELSRGSAVGSGLGLWWGSAAAAEFVWNQLLVSLFGQVKLWQEQESLSLSLADCSRMGCSSQPLAVVEATEIRDLDCLLVVQVGPSEKKG